MKYLRMSIAVSALIGLASLSACNQAAPDLEPGALETTAVKSAKVLLYGWDSPTPAEAKGKVDRLNAAPFDAVSFRHSGARRVFTRRPLPKTPFDRDIADLKSLNSSKLSESFLRMQINAEAGWDWTNDKDWAAFASNLRNYARVAKAGGLKGILFDPEPYGYNVWNYETQPAKNAQSFEVLEAKARARGADFMRILAEEYPGITVFSLKMFSQKLWALDDDPTPEEVRKVERNDAFHGLWYGFANGMVSELGRDITLIDGNEPAYYYLSESAFKGGVDDIYGKLTLFLDPDNVETFRAQVDVAQAAYADGVLNLFNSPKFIGYYLANDAERRKLLEHNLYYGLRTSDAYVWLYAEDLRWWSDENVPDGFESLIRRTREKVVSGKPLDFGTGFIEQAREGYDARVRLGGAFSPNVPKVTFKVEGAPDTACTAFNNGRNYGCTFPAGASVTVTPVAKGVTFAPSSRRYDALSTDIEDRFRQDYGSR